MKKNHYPKELARKLKFIMVVRLVIVTLVLAAGSFALQVERIPFYTIIAVFYLATLLYAVLLRFRFPVYLLAYIQIIVDIVLETIIIHYAGGADSIYAFLYAPSIIAAGVLISAQAAKLVAGLGSLFYGLLSLAEYEGFIVPITGAEILYREGPWIIMFIVCFRIIIFCLIGYLASHLSHSLFQERTALRNLRNLNDLILNNIASGVITIDNQGRIVYLNPPASAILAKKTGDLLGGHWANLFLSGAKDDTESQFFERAAKPIGTEINLLQADGKKIILGCNYSALFDENDKLLGGVITFRDLTVLKQLELEVRQREKLSGMGELAMGIAHELRNPLASIRGSLEVLKERGHFSDEGEKLVGVIIKESERLNRIIEDFLKYAREKRKEVKYEDLGQILDEVWVLLKHQGRWPTGIKLSREISQPKIMLNMDPEQIKQVFYNLFINSLEAMPQGGQVSVAISEQPECVMIKVKDTGSGIRAEEQDKVFQRFYSTKSYGLGIGLAITRRIVEEHGGRIKLHSVPGEGAEVTVVLPK